jgi:arginyl-tRNA synthetase
VVAINHLGDWGTNFGKLICAYKMWSSKEKIERDGVIELEHIYARFNKEAQENDSLNQDARDAFSELEKGNAEYLEIWRYVREISLKEYMKTYELLDIGFDSFNGESFFTDKMPAVVEELREKGLLKIDDGASVVDLSAYNMPPALILKRDGSTLYPTRDIAAAEWRKKEYDFDKCIYVTSAGQSLHFAQLFKVVELMGYDWAKDLVHVPYGTMSFNGEKLASRTGNIIYLDDLLAQAIEKAEKIIEEKNADLPDKHKTAVAVGVGAVVFNALFNSRIKDVDFSWDTALSFEGNTGPYIQYTYARACSVLKKCSDKGDYGGYEPNADEKQLVKQLMLFGEKVVSAMKEYEPSVITRYLLETCGIFNQFYHNSPIIRAEENAKCFRVALTSAFREIAGRCIELLGMKKTEEI